jgi:glycosyltransferase involved in cell wall biosynthesis
MNKDIFPSISCIIATYNSSATVKECLDGLFVQNYPKDKIEVIIVDGGSKDNTIEIVNKYKVRLYKVPPEKQEAEYNKGIGISHAKNDMILLIDIDNILPHKNWLKKMVKPLVENERIVGCEVLRFHYNPKDYMLDRYFALIGGVDPVPYYLGKDAKLSWAFDKYNLRGKSTDCGDYYLVEFEPRKIPTIGANGFILRRKLLKYAKYDPNHFFHTDVNYDLIAKGFNAYAFVKDDIIHLKKTKFSYFLKFLIRRKYIMETQYFEQVKKRRYAVYMPSEDKLGLMKYVIYSLTFIKPTLDAFRGYIKVRDIAWFLHPIVCFSFLIIYGWAVAARVARKWYNL